MPVRAILIWLLLAGTAWAGTSASDITGDLPPVVTDTARPPICTVTYLISDLTTNDTIAVRMQIAPDPNDTPVDSMMPCPREIPPRVASRALDACIRRAADPRHCVFADMSREFRSRPRLANTAENSARCESDKAADIGLACWRSGSLDICNVGCGDSPASAIAAAVARCEAKQQQPCKLTGSLPVLAPR